MKGNYTTVLECRKAVCKKGSRVVRPCVERGKLVKERQGKRRKSLTGLETRSQRFKEDSWKRRRSRGEG